MDSNSLVTDSVDLSEEEENSDSDKKSKINDKNDPNRALQSQASQRGVLDTLKYVTQKSYQKKKIVTKGLSASDLKINRQKERRISTRRTGM